MSYRSGILYQSFAVLVALKHDEAFTFLVRIFSVLKFAMAEKVIKNLILKRKHQKQDWGFTITGGWQQGQWIGK